MRTLPIHIDRLRIALESKGVRLKHHNLLEVAAAAFGYSNQNQLTSAARSGDLDPPAAMPVGRATLAGHDMAVVSDGDGRPFAFDASLLGAQGKGSAFMPTPYGGLADMRGLAELPIIETTAGRSEDIHAASVTHKHGDTLFLDRTAEGLDDQIADFCRHWWHQIAERKGVPETADDLSDEDLIEIYFGERSADEVLTRYGYEAYFIGPVDFARDTPFVPSGFDMKTSYVIGRMMPHQKDEPVLYWSNSNGWGDVLTATRFDEPVDSWPLIGVNPGSLFVVPVCSSTASSARRAVASRDIVFLTNRECDVQGPEEEAAKALPWVEAEEMEVGLGPVRTADIGYAALVDGKVYLAPTIKTFHFDQDDSVRAMLENRDELQEYADAIEPVIKAVGGMAMLEEDSEAVTLTIFVPLAETLGATDMDAWKAALQDLLTPGGDGSRIMATFRPQTMIGGGCHDADALGNVSFDVTYEIKLMGDEARTLEDDDQIAEDLTDAIRAPAWIRDWNGPFGVEVREAIADHFGFDSDDR